MSFLLEIGLILVVLLAFLAIGLVLYARWNYGTLEANGIPTVKPHWLLGSNYNYGKLVHHWEDLYRAQALGPVYGVYNGRTPEIYVSDPELLRLIFLKESHNFANKSEVDFGHPVINEAIELVNGEKWKVIRAILSPLFTTGKIKQLSEIIVNLSDDYVGVLVKQAKAQDNRPIKMDFIEFLPPFAVQVIGECFCGIKLDNPRDPENSFVNKMKALLWDDVKFDSTYNLTRVFPFLRRFLPSMPADTLSFMVEACKSILDEREKSGQKSQDTVNAFIEMRQKINTKEYKRLKITENTVYGQAFEFFIASYFGILTSIAYLTYHLAIHPEINEKVMQEVDVALEKSKGKVNYEAVQELPYLLACLNETHRKTPGFFRIDRVCTNDTHFKGFKFAKGIPVIAPLYAIHHNPEIYPEPEIFNPDRFLAENKNQLISGTFMTFGAGHRQCVGVKFVNEMIKIFMLRMLKEFRIEKRADTVWKEYPGSHLFVQLDPIYVDLVKRN